MRSRHLALLALTLSAACASLPRQDTFANGPFEEALAELEQLPEAEHEAFVAAIARSRLALAATSETASVRTAVFARLALGGAGTHALLESLVASSDTDVKTRALLALTLRGDGSARSRLAAFASDEDDTLRSRGRVAEAYDLSQRRALERLGSTIADERRAALHALDDIDSAEVVSALLAVARRDPDPSVQAAACRAMPSLSGPDRTVLQTIAEEARATPVVTACTKRLLLDASNEEAMAFVEGLADPADDLAIARAQGALAAFDRDEPGDAKDALTAYILRALAAPRPSIRAAAAGLLTAQRNEPTVRNALIAALRDEPEPDAKLAIAAALRNDTASRARVLAMLHTLVPLETHAGLEAAALAVALEGFTPETQAKIELATRSPVATERALAFRVFVRALDMRRALEGLFDIDEGVRFGIAVQVLDP